MRERWWLIGALVAAACGERTLPPAAGRDGGADAPADAPLVGEGGAEAGPGALAPPAHSGSRLKARWSVAPDGRRAFLGWRDTQLGVNCSFNMATDGEYRCLPGGAVTSVSPSEFADAACTQAVILAGRTVPASNLGEAACLPLSYIVQYDFTFTRCNPGVRIFHLGAEVTTGRTYSRIGGCLPGFLPQGTTAFTLGDEAPPATFVRARRRGFFNSPTDPVHRSMLDADDGAQQSFGWQDPSTQAACRLLRLHDDRIHCLTAVTTGASSAFVDAACAQPAALGSSCLGSLKYSDTADPGVCPPVYTVRGVGDRVSSYFSSANGTCQSVAAGPNTPYYATGPVVPPGTFPALDMVDEPSGRLRRRLESVAGAPAFVTGWFDADRGEPCRPIAFGDQFRCVPLPPEGRGPHYADSACTAPLTVLDEDRCPERYTFDVDERACPVRLRLYTLGPRHGGPIFVSGFDRTVDPPRATCTPHQRRSGETFYPVTPVPDTDLAELTVVVE